ncbi:MULTISPECIES: DUF1127 domain-containing protein [Azorhizobium]|nr:MULTISPECIES: DUF1127 domain-containing protein [Azorhizobium]TDT93417.1 uncharacterized protein YjiS (DUF1127 family) [Azorhizobium sp. AG788]
MATFGENSSAFYAPVSVRFGLAARALVRTVRNITRAMIHRRDVATLGEMSDAMLKDIGLDRSDLRDAAASPWWSDPTDVLVTRSVERQAARRLVQRELLRHRGLPEKGW